MRVLIHVLFWGNCLAILNSMIRLTVSTYPRTETFSIGEDLVRFIGAIVMVAWGGYILWG